MPTFRCTSVGYHNCMASHFSKNSPFSTFTICSCGSLQFLICKKQAWDGQTCLFVCYYIMLHTFLARWTIFRFSYFYGCCWPAPLADLQQRTTLIRHHVSHFGVDLPNRKQRHSAARGGRTGRPLDLIVFIEASLHAALTRIVPIQRLSTAAASTATSDWHQ